MHPEPLEVAADQVRVGLGAEFERDVDERDVLDFARNSGDFNPLHVDVDYALGSNFRGRIAHGAFQVGLASALLGMYLPGKRVLLHSINARFPAPLYFPCRVKVRGEVASWNRETQGGVLNVQVVRAGDGLPFSEIAMGFGLHGARAEDTPEAAPTSRPARPPDDGRGVVLVTGASGGIGSAIVADLARDHHVLALVNSQPLHQPTGGGPSVEALRVDLSAPGWERPVEDHLGDRTLLGVVHAAWPGAPQGGLLQARDEVIERQLAFGTTATIRLARLLFARPDPGGGRFVALGSAYGTSRPVLNLASYSLGKAALEHTVRLLAPELARRKVTINALCPSYVPVGLNKQADERQRKVEAARVPLGRLCAPDDVAGAVRYLLSPGSAFLSGRTIELSGGQL